MKFSEFLEMAAPRETDVAKYYWHGTSLENGKSIMQTGIDPEYTNLKWKKNSYLRPANNMIYITTSLRMAIIYALGGDMLGSKFLSKKSYGMVVRIPGSELKDIQPDEDEIGSILNNILSSDMEEIKKYYKNYNWDLLTPQHLQRLKYLAKNVLTDNQFKQMSSKWGKGSETAFQANIGKKIVKYLPDDLKYLIMDIASNIAHQGKLMPDKAWVIDINRSIELEKDGSNFFDVATEYK